MKMCPYSKGSGTSKMILFPCFALVFLHCCLVETTELSCFCDVDVPCHCNDSSGPALLRTKRQGYFCTEVDLLDIGVPLPLVIPQPFKLTDSSNGTWLRCADGMVLDMPTKPPGYIEGGYFEVSCTAGNWVKPASWPDNTSCTVSGDNCTVDSVDNANFLPLYLAFDTAAGQDVVSGGRTKVICKDSTKVLDPEYDNFDVECYDGKFVKTELPDYASCRDPATCTLAQLDNMLPGMPSYMSLVTTTQIIPHEGTIEFTCANGRKLTADIDPGQTNLFSLTCDNGAVLPPAAWPTNAQCLMFCSNFPATPVGAQIFGSSAPVPQGTPLVFDCTAPGDVFTHDLFSTSIELMCQSNGTFTTITPWPSCVPVPECGVPVPPFIDSGLILEDTTNSSVQLWDKAVYPCLDSDKITDLGQKVEIPCQLVGGNATFIFPSQWELEGTVCRARKNCSMAPPLAPEGLSMETLDPYFVNLELSVITYKCTNPAFVFYRMGEILQNQTVFEVVCGVGGYYDEFIDWPTCEDPKPPMCTNYPPPPSGVPISIVEEKPQAPGGYVTYKCTDSSLVSTLGEEIRVYCYKDVDKSIFITPLGWAQSRCNPKKYPEFSEPPCFCLGDSRLSPDQSKLILDNACRSFGYKADYDSKRVPLKQRCGVTDPDNPTKSSLCHCSEKNDNAADFAIWSFAEIKSNVWKYDLSDSTTELFWDLAKEFQKQIDERIIDNWPNPGWKYVQSKVMQFLPGLPLACSARVLPTPDDASGLEVLTKKPVQFGGYGEYVCKNKSLVTNDGVTFKLPCDYSGQFMRRDWLPCRERKVCSRLPPIPDFKTGLWLSESQNVPEFDSAIYNCKDPNMIVPNTSDGKFRVPCQRTGLFQSPTTFKWPNCTTKPTNVCQPVPTPPAGYIAVTPTSLYMHVGESVVFKCEKDGQLIGDATTLSFKCMVKNGSYAFDGWTDGMVLPACRVPLECPIESLPIPTLDSGLSQPYLVKNIKELEYVDYNCFQKGVEWKLFGDYTTNQFHGTDVEIVNGNLRVYCPVGKAGVPGQVAKWPTCRDTTITSCDPTLLQFGSTGLQASKNTPVKVTDTVTISCSQPGYVNPDFGQLVVPCGYDGNFEVPEILSTCRLGLECPAPPEAPAGKNLLKDTSSAAPIFEFQSQVYLCEDNFTLSGVQDPLVKNGMMHLPCNLTADKLAWVQPASWPSCVEVKTTCVDFDTTIMDGYITTDTLPVTVGGQITASCAKTGYVTSFGKSIKLTCTDSGYFDYPDPAPPCRPAVPCDTNPFPTDATRLMNSTSANVMEWDFAYYTCVRGSTFNNATIPLLVSGKFPLQCGLLGKYPDPVQWGICEIAECLTLPVPTGYKTTAVAPVPVNVTINFTCSTSGFIPGNSDQPVPVTCQPNGTFTEISWPVCRAKVSCRASPTPNITTTALMGSASTGLMEFDYAVFECKPGASLVNITFPGVVDNKFLLQCPLGGTFPPTANVTWPSCRVEACTAHFVKAGYTSTAPLPVDVAKTAEYRCSTAGQVTDLGATFPLVCGPAGTFVPPSPLWPLCRSPKTCLVPPTPPATSKLANSVALSVNEFSYANYLCKGDGTYLSPTTGLATNSFGVLCKFGATYETVSSWPICNVSNCMTVPSSIGLTAVNRAPIPVGSGVTYNCSTAGQVTRLGKSFVAPCNADGSVVIPSPAPTCKAALTCATPPTPPASSKLNATASTNLKEYDTAIYTCLNGFTLASVVATGVSNNQFLLTCGSGGIYPASPSWPTCQVESCLTVPTMTGFKTTVVAPVVAGANVPYTCETDGQVTDSGQVIYLTCSNVTGLIALPATIPTCRAALTCPGPPAPPSTSQLQTSTSTGLIEFQAAVYACNTGLTLDHVTSRSDVKGGQFHLTCGTGAAYPASPSWVTCLAPCTTNPVTLPAEIVPVTTSTISVISGFATNYKCTDPLKVFNDSKYLSLVCGTDANFITPATWPTCRVSTTCLPPVPPAATKLQLSSTSPSPLHEFDLAIYTCVSGYTLAGVTPNNSTFETPCPYGGGNFTIGTWPSCVVSPTVRKKRYVDYNSIYGDIDYSTLVVFETQFMHTKGVENDILKTANFSMENANYVNSIIDIFHSRLPSVLKQEKLWRLTLKFPILPTCEQPMNPTFPIAKCFRSRLASGCANDVVKATWLDQMGYTLKKQNPNWIANSQNQENFRVPTGGGVEFYCLDSLNRPKKDLKDGNKYDGVISAHCSHNGIMNISMNPADWDRCRRQCAVQKPTPPTIPGAQLKLVVIEGDDLSTDVDRKETRLLWEEEMISYKCDNTSLVLDHQKGIFVKNYACQSDGTYSTPTANVAGSRWPECTTPPVDPLIINAVVLLTNTFDLNIIYRHDSTQSKGKEPNVLDSSWAILNITIPAIIAILCFTFFIMCCTRAKSPICKIFEPQA